MGIQSRVSPDGIFGMCLDANSESILSGRAFSRPPNLSSGIVGTFSCVAEDCRTTPDYIFGPSVGPFLLLTSKRLVFGKAAVLVFQATTAMA